MVIQLRSLFMLVPYGFTEVKCCKLVLSVCGHIHLRSKNIFPNRDVMIYSFSVDPIHI